MVSRTGNRLNKELQDLTTNYKDMFTVEVVSEGSSTKLPVWHVSFTMEKGTVYEGEKYTLKFKFDDKYPFECAEVTFVGNPPEHEHVY